MVGLYTVLDNNKHKTRKITTMRAYVTGIDIGLDNPTAFDLRNASM
jgi:hypothetical protein